MGQIIEAFSPLTTRAQRLREGSAKLAWYVAQFAYYIIVDPRDEKGSLVPKGDGITIFPRNNPK